PGPCSPPSPWPSSTSWASASSSRASPPAPSRVRRLQRPAREAEPLIVAGPLGEMAAEVDQPHVERAQLLRPLQIQALALEDDEVLLLVGRDEDGGLAIGVIP